jgi:hypothetical protein
MSHIPTAGQMLLGFILPFALAFIAIPLESLIHSSRTVGGVALLALMRSLAFLLRVSGNVARQMSRVLIRLYDVAIVVPLLGERLFKARAPKAAERSEPGSRKKPIEVDIEIERTRHA